MKYNVKRLKRWAFKKWKQYWFEKRVIWKLELRAEIHYKMQVKLKIFKKWLYFVIKKKESHIQSQIVQAFYHRNLKIKCFIKLSNQNMLINFMQSYGEVYHTYLVYLYLNLHILQFTKMYYETFLEYYLQLLLKINYEKRLKTYTLRKLKKYAAHVKQNQINTQKAKIYFLTRFGHEYLHMYFLIWKRYATKRKFKKIEKEKAINHHQRQLMKHSVEKLFSYYCYRKRKNANNERALLFLMRKLKMKVLCKWKVYVESKQIMRNKFRMASEYYDIKLKKLCFKSLRNYVSYQNNLRQKLLQYNYVQERRMKKQYFLKMKDFWLHKIQMKQKYNLAKNHYKSRLFKKSFDSLQLYKHYHIKRKIHHEYLIKCVQERIQHTILKRCFDNWMKYKLVQNHKLFKINLGIAHYQKHLLKKILQNWSLWLKRKQERLHLTNLCEKHFEMKNLSKIFKTWKIYAANEKSMRQKLDCAKKVYRKNLLKEGIRVIIINGLAKQKQREDQAFKNLRKSLDIARKYFKIWKNNVKHTPHKNIFEGEILPKYTISNNFPIKQLNTEPFKWNPLCFMKPRIPKFLTNVG